MSFQPNKIDPILGLKVEENLKSLSIHTPTTGLLRSDPNLKIKIIKDAQKTIWETLGLDMSDDSLMETPNRIAKMFVNEIYWGLVPENFPKCTVIENKMNFDEMVVERGITVMSNCEHHGVVIDGQATVAYIPGNNILGLSKLNRIVEYFSRRPQVQERLTIQIAETLKFILETDDVAVVIDAKHYCVKSRGVEDSTSSTITSSLSGAFKIEHETRSEFMSLSRINK